LGLKNYLWLSRYDSKLNNITTEFFIPALSSSTVYRRIAGLFSSTTFALSARGLKELIANYGQMQLIISPILNKEDIEAIKDSSDLQRLIERSLKLELEQIEDEFVKNHINALKFLLKEGFLEIRVDVPKDEKGVPLDVETILKSTATSEKRGIFQDRDGHAISFRGPINESKESWEKGVHEITVDLDWIEGQRQHVLDDINIFEEIWNRPETLPLPTSIKEELIRTAPDPKNINIENFDYPPWAKIPNGGILWPHQIRAVNAWLSNDHYGIFTMATGSGKTLTSLASVNIAGKGMMVIVIAYGKTLVRQWEREIKKYDESSDVVVCDSSTNWKNVLPGKLVPYLRNGKDFYINNRLYVLATPQTAASDVFQSNFENIDTNDVQLIADEVHHLGSEEFSKVFNLQSSRRIGLSATYRRDWDEPGTSLILNYFGRDLEEAAYGISEAIKDGRLCKYRYFPYFAYLNREEFNQYVEISLQVKIEFAKLNLKEKSLNLPTVPKKLERLLRDRAEILKKSSDKIRVFANIINDDPHKPYVVFADDNLQADELRSAYIEKINQMNLESETFLKDDIIIFSGLLDDWQREKVIHEAKYKGIPLIAMYCLDEGIDIPELRGAIIVSSSSSKRQYIQRRGRILRLGEKHKVAELYDIIVFAHPDSDPVRNEIAQDIISKERERLLELAADSDNKFESILKIEREIEKAGFTYIL
jgi:superfamily II DNA or RNA helicase